MKSALKLLLLFFITLSQFQLLVGQKNVIKGKILDDVGKPIKFATISYIGQNIGTYSDTLGAFVLRKVDSDTIIISHIGYKSQILPTDRLEKYVNIKLESEIQDISEVIVLGKKNNHSFRKKMSYDNGKKSDKKSNPMYYGMLNAIYFSNIKLPCRIEKVSMFVTNSCPTNNQIRVRFFTVDSITKKPGIDFVNENILISKIKKNSWLHIQLKDYKIILPTTDFFIVLESLSNGNDCFNANTTKDSKGSYNLSVASVETKANGYRKFFDRNWKNQTEEIGDKDLSKEKIIQYHQEQKELLLKGKTDKNQIETLSSYLDQQLAKDLDRIDDKWNFVPYIRIETKTTANNVYKILGVN